MKILKLRRIKLGGKKHIDALSFDLSGKKLIVLRGSRGYIMCGYLNLKVAEKFKDIAAKIIGISSIEEALKSRIHSSTKMARSLGIFKGQFVKQALKIIA